MSAGAKDQPITLQRNTRTPDGAGGSTQAWADFTDVPNVWANVTAKSGREGWTRVAQTQPLLCCSRSTTAAM